MAGPALTVLTASAASAQMASVGPTVRQVRGPALAHWLQESRRGGRPGEGRGQRAPEGWAPHVGTRRWARGCGCSTQASGPQGVRLGCDLGTGQCPFRTEPGSAQAGRRAWARGSHQAPSPQPQLDGALGASEVRQPAVRGRHKPPPSPACTPGSPAPSCSQQWRLFLPSPWGLTAWARAAVPLEAP